MIIQKDNIITENHIKNSWSPSSLATNSEFVSKISEIVKNNKFEE